MQTSIHAGNIARFYMIISWVLCLWLMFQGYNFQWLQSRNNDFVFTRSKVEILKQKREGNYNMQIRSLTARCLGYIVLSLYRATGVIRHVIQPCGNKRIVGCCLSEFKQASYPLILLDLMDLTISADLDWQEEEPIFPMHLIIHGAGEGRLEKEIMLCFLFEKEPAVPFCHSSQSYSTACLIFVCTTSYCDLAIAQGYYYNKGNSNEARN